MQTPAPKPKPRSRRLDADARADARADAARADAARADAARADAARADAARARADPTCSEAEPAFRPRLHSGEGKTRVPARLPPTDWMGPPRSGGSGGFSLGSHFR